MESLTAAVSDLINAKDGSATTAWYNLEKDMKAAMGAISAINEKFAKQIKAVGDALEGETGEAFTKYATSILNTSNEVYDTLTGKQFDVTMGNIGRASQAFVNTWWQVQAAGKQVYEQRVAALKADAQRKIDAATDQAAAAAVVAQLPLQVIQIKQTSDAALLKDLQNALGTLGNAYNARGADLVPLYISDGDTTTAAPGDSYQAQTRNRHSDQNNQNNPGKLPDPVVSGPTQGDSGYASGPVEPVPATGTQPGPGDQQPSFASGPVEPVPAKGTQPGQGEQPSGFASGPVEPVPATGTPPVSGAAPTGGGKLSPDASAALGDAKKAVGDTLDGLAAKTDNPDRKQALQDAKDAAQGAINGLTGGAPGEAGGTGSAGGVGGAPDPGTGAGGGLAPSMAGLADAKKAASKAIDDLGKKTDDPERKQALDDAKRAAEKAIDGLTSPGAPGSLTGGPGEPTVADAKDAAADAIDGLSKPDDSEARQQALDDAKDAASDAVDGILGQEGTDPAASAERAQLLDAKEAANKAIDDLICETDDPERKQALEDAKDAMNSAIDKMAAPEHFGQIQDAKLAADKAIDGLGSPGDDAQRQEQLAAAKEAANDAIDRINDSPELTGPEHDKALAQAKEDAAKAIDGLSRPDDSPAERQALADAKTAANKAIDAIGGSSTAGGSGGGSGSSTRDFLAPSTPTGQGLATGGGATGGGGTATSGGAPAAKFDTQPLSAAAPISTQGGPTLTGAPAGLGTGQQGGMPMGPMGPMGGGMGGSPGGQEEKEREPQIWIQADKGAWGEDDDSQSHVLGRS
ncbi:large repetitive protein [Amycolatopsis orientalis]|uniref:large repetitive protein n=1 Tax=Amycolatopsis orientalis TaxID=31958 RepID=UPI001F299705|nr:large repetitive protein [Amycolatopsis orientalis]